MDNLNTVRQLNNDGVTNLAEGNMTAALSILRRALQGLRMGVGGDGDDDGNGAEILDNVLPAPRSSRQIIPHACLMHPSLLANDIRVSPTNVFQPFTKVLVLPESARDSEEITVVLLHNFGVSLQQKGLLQGDQDTLRKARRIFLMERDLVQVLEDRGRHPYPLVALALWNNLGQLHSHFLELEGVRTCRQRLHYYFSRAREAQRNELDAEDLHFFHQAIIFLEVCDVEARAASA